MFENTINMFSGRYDFLSNFYYSKIEYNGKIWPTSEHLFQSLKTDVPHFQENIRKADTPGLAKKMGRSVALRQDWEQVKNTTMHTVIGLKFSQNLDLKKKLMETIGFELEEGNFWHDNYWGNCLCPKCVKLNGFNVLGKILMITRMNFFKDMSLHSKDFII